MPENRPGEWGLALAKVLVSFIPAVGGSAAEVLGAIIQPQLDKRKKAWFEELANKLEQLRQRMDNVTPEKLAESPQFSTALLHASTIALRSHQTEKLSALRNAVLNVAASIALSDDFQLMCLDAIDTLTPSHLQMLAYFAGPKEWASAHGKPLPPYTMGGADAPLQEAMPELKGHRDLMDLLYNDLSRRGLVGGDANTLHMAMTGQGMVEPRITPLGHQFLQFISSPIPDEEN